MKQQMQYYIIAGAFLFLTAIGRTLDKLSKGEISGKLAFTVSFLFSIIGGIIAGMIASVYIETIQLQWIFIAAGAWMGERVLDVVADALEDKITLIFKKQNKDEK